MKSTNAESMPKKKMDVISQLGGVTIGDGAVRFGSERLAMVAAKVGIDDKDFTERFDGSRWVVSWKWIDGPSTMKSRIAEYAINPKLRIAYEDEVRIAKQEAIENGFDFESW